MKDKLTALQRVLDIMDELREKCPWDRKQTIESLRILTIEETFELADAITDMDMDGIAEELGDLLLHIVFYAKIGEEKKAFDISSICNSLCEKLIRRHPHIYGDVDVANEEEVKQNWERIKLQEKGKKSALEGVPRSMPALPKALRIQEKSKKVGFEWDTTEQVWAKVEEEMAELQEAVAKGDKVEMEKEFGDVLFSLANYARFIEVDPEGALEKTNHKFIKRFQKIEEIVRSDGKELTDLDLLEMDALWNIVKRDIR